MMGAPRAYLPSPICSLRESPLPPSWLPAFKGMLPDAAKVAPIRG